MLGRVKKRAARLLPKNKFLRSVSVLAGGTAAGQAIVLLASPLLTRLYSPSDYGVLAVFGALLAILTVIASFRYELAIVLPKSKRSAGSVIALCLYLLLGVTAVTALVVALFRQPIALLFNTPVLASYLWLLPPALFLAGLYQILRFWALREKAFSAISQTKIAQSGGSVAFQLAAFSLGPLGLLIGRIIGQAAGSVTLWRRVAPGGILKRRTTQSKNMIAVGRQYKQFPVYSSGAGLLNTGGAQMAPMFFAALFGPAVAGAYLLAQRVIEIPMTVIGAAVADAFLPDSVAANREGRLDSAVTSLIEGLAIFIFPAVGVLFVIAPELFAVVFGAEWRQAGEIVRWLAPMLAIRFLVNPNARVFIAQERQGVFFVLQTTLFLLRFGALGGAAIFGMSVLSTVKLFSLASAIGYLLNLYIVMRSCGIRPFNMARYLFYPVVLSVVAGLIAFIVNSSVSPPLIGMPLAVVSSGAVVVMYWVVKMLRINHTNKQSG